MKRKKSIVFALIVLLTAVLVVGCGGGNDPAPDNGSVQGPSFRHGTDGAFANCGSGCHNDIADSHADFTNYEDNCLDCHAAE